MSDLLTWIVCGLIVGLIAHWLVAGRSPGGFLRTILAGITGAVAGGLLYGFVRGRLPIWFGSAWEVWIFPILGAFVVILIYTRWRRGSWGGHWSWRRWW
ncbi:MAG TPA: GlsB/YeaQ/YmgE family stress response membrane protein [Gemmataceae bacterium]|nr:GlsB/YeaQ/YmgE family stress response membrane protein [Gemmataceae bacterium]